jgi:hypothetical protein
MRLNRKYLLPDFPEGGDNPHGLGTAPKESLYPSVDTATKVKNNLYSL